MLPHLLEILLVGQEAIQSYYLPVQMILIFNGSPLVIKQWGYVTGGSLGNKTVTLPITAPSQIVNVHNTHATNSAGSSAGDNNDCVVVLSSSQISVRTDHSVKNAYWLVLCY